MKKHLFILSFLYAIWLWSQSTVIPDPNFKRFLSVQFPTYLNNQGQLVDSLALKYTGSINCSNWEIANIDGIEKFRNIKSLNCSDNTLTSIKHLADFKSLSELFANNNLLDSISGLEQLTNLNILQLSNNRISLLPNLANNTNLKILQIDRNRILKILGLEKLTNLETLILYENKVTDLGDLNNLKNLQILECHGNLITHLSGLESLTKLSILVAGANVLKNTGNISSLKNLSTISFYLNQITQMPDISNLTNLSVIDFNANQIKYLPAIKNKLITNIRIQDNVLDSVGNLDSLKDLKELILKNNQLEKIPPLYASAKSLETLDLAINHLNFLPNLSNFNNLKILNIQNNALTFEDIIPLKVLPYYSNFTVTPQKNIPTNGLVTIKEGMGFNFSLNIDKTVTTNIYEWYKDDSLLFKSKNDSLIFRTIKKSDAGIYRCIITNPNVPELSLLSDPISIIVNPCIDLQNLTYKSTDITCDSWGTIEIETQSILSENRSFKFLLCPKISFNDTIESNENKFMYLSQNKYEIIVKNDSGCQNSKSIFINGTKTNCTEYAIIINSPPVQSSGYYFEKTGEINIYNANGIMVQKLNGPIFWDGSTANNGIIPGLYIAEQGSTKIEITVIK